MQRFIQGDISKLVLCLEFTQQIVVCHANADVALQRCAKDVREKCQFPDISTHFRVSVLAPGAVIVGERVRGAALHVEQQRVNRLVTVRVHVPANTQAISTHTHNSEANVNARVLSRNA